MSKAASTTEIEDPLTEVVGDVEIVMEELAAQLTAKLFGTLARLNAPLERECGQKEAEGQELRAKHRELQTRVEAQQRVLAVETDRAIAEGRDADAGAKRQESAEIERNLGNILAQASRCDDRARTLQAAIQANYRVVFEGTYPELRRGCCNAAIALCQCLDQTWATILEFENQSGLVGNRGFVRSQHRVDLTPDDHGPQEKFFSGLRRWFGGRQ